MKMRNDRHNPVSAIAYQLAGGYKEFYSLSKEARLALRAKARESAGVGPVVTKPTPQDRPPVIPREQPKRFREAPQSEPWGYVYAVTHPRDPGYVKIGRSKNPYRRITDANTWCRDTSYTLEFFVYVADDGLAESLVHDALDPHRCGDTEWFKVPLMEAFFALQAVKDEEPA